MNQHETIFDVVFLKMNTIIEGEEKKSTLDLFLHVSTSLICIKRYVGLRFVKIIQFLLFFGKTS